MGPRLARFTSLCRLAIGAAFVLRPELAMRPWIGRESARPAARLLARAVGMRDVVLAVGALTAPAEQLEPWLLGGLVADAADLGLTIDARRHLPSRGAALVCAIAGAGAALGGAATWPRRRSLARRPAGPAWPGGGESLPAAARRAELA